jgi:hypothetical protein
MKKGIMRKGLTAPRRPVTTALLRKLRSPAVGSAILGVALIAAGCDSDSGSAKSIEDVSLAIALDNLADATTVMDDVWASIENHPSIASLKVVGVPMVTVGAVGVETQGRTFVMDSTALPQLLYVADETRPGAPADGTRFVLYEPDADGGSPKQPFVESGYVDIIDQGSGEISVTIVHPESGPLSYTGSGVFEPPDPTVIANAGNSFPGTREISYAGSIVGPSQTLTFQYRDKYWTRDERTLLVDAAGGELLYNCVVEGDIFDSDMWLTLQVGLRSGADVLVKASGPRSIYLGWGDEIIAGTAPLGGDLVITVSDCEIPGRENAFEICYLLGDNRVNSPVIDEYASYIKSGKFPNWCHGTIRHPPHWPSRAIFALEAMSAPLLFALAQ